MAPGGVEAVEPGDANWKNELTFPSQVWLCRAEPWAEGEESVEESRGRRMRRTLVLSSPCSHIPQKHNCQLPDENENLPWEFKKAQKKKHSESTGKQRYISKFLPELGISFLGSMGRRRKNKW